MKILNANKNFFNVKDDDFLIECIEIDLYDIMYEAAKQKLDSSVVNRKINGLLREYQRQGYLKAPISWANQYANPWIALFSGPYTAFPTGFGHSATVEVTIWTPIKQKVKCCVKII